MGAYGGIMSYTPRNMIWLWNWGLQMAIWGDDNHMFPPAVNDEPFSRQINSRGWNQIMRYSWIWFADLGHVCPKNALRNWDWLWSKKDALLFHVWFQGKWSCSWWKICSNIGHFFGPRSCKKWGYGFWSFDYYHFFLTCALIIAAISMGCVVVALCTRIIKCVHNIHVSLVFACTYTYIHA